MKAPHSRAPVRERTGLRLGGCSRLGHQPAPVHGAVRTRMPLQHQRRDIDFMNIHFLTHIRCCP